MPVFHMAATKISWTPSWVTTTVFGPDPAVTAAGTVAYVHVVPGIGADSQFGSMLHEPHAQPYMAYTFFVDPQTTAWGFWPLSTRDQLVPRSVLR